MSVGRMIASGTIALLLSIGSLAAGHSELADAVMKGDKAAVRTLLQQKTDVNAPQADGATALHWAVYQGDVETVDLLIRAGANATAANREGTTPLLLASLNGDVAIIDRLLKAGVDVNEGGPNGETALMMAARNGNPDAIKLLLKNGADVNANETLRSTTALMWAAEQQHPAAVKALIEGGADLSARSGPAGVPRPYLAPTPKQRLQGAQGGNAGAQPGRQSGRRGQTPGRSKEGAAQGQQTPPSGPDQAEQDQEQDQPQGGARGAGGGGLTALVLAARQGDIESARVMLEAKADVNQPTEYGWTPLLTAVKNNHYKLAVFLLEHGSDPNIVNKGGWSPLYLATDNRNIEGGDYPTRKPDMDHLEFIKVLLDRGADVNARAKDSTETRTIFTMQWLYEDGATPFLRAAQSSDLVLMKLLLERGADPKIPTANNDNALMVASGIGWVEGVTYEWGEKENVEAVKMLLDLGLDVNAVDRDGRTALHGAAHKGRNEVVQLLVDHGAKLDARDGGSRDTINGDLLGHTWLPLDYAQGLVRVGVQSAIPHPETADLIRKLMTERGMEIPNATLDSICITAACK